MRKDSSSKWFMWGDLCLMVVLWILGEAKSGKSELAEAIFTHLPGRKFYIGTLPRTPRWMDTIRKHEARRPKSWGLIEIADSMDVATELISRIHEREVVSVLLDGWGVYLRRRAIRWGMENANATMADEESFIDQIYMEYRRLVDVCDYLIVVEHISASSPTMTDYEADPVSWRVGMVVSKCIAEADRVIYHDIEDVSHKDERYVKRMAEEMISIAGIRGSR